MFILSLIIIILFLSFPGVIIVDFFKDHSLRKLLSLFIPFTSISFYAVLQFVFSQLSISFSRQNVYLALLLLFTAYLITKIIKKDLSFATLKSFKFSFKREYLLVITPAFVFLLIQIYAVYGNSFPMAGDDTVFHYALI